MELLLALLISFAFAAPTAKTQALKTGAAAIPSQQPSNDEALNSCKTPKDCMKAATACGGVIAINKKFRKKWADQVVKLKAANSCSPLSEEAKMAAKELRVACTKSLCDLM